MEFSLFIKKNKQHKKNGCSNPMDFIIVPQLLYHEMDCMQDGEGADRKDVLK